VQSQHDVASLHALGAETITGDLRDPASLGPFVRGAEGATVFHCAGIIHPERHVRDLYDINTHGTKHLIAAAAAVGCKRFVYVSSNSPAGTNLQRERLFDERTPDNPYLHYGRSKQQAEQALLDAHRNGHLETVVVRPPWFYGPGQPARQTLFFTMIRTGKAPVVVGGANLRSMGYVDNVCQGLDLCARVPHAAGRTWWIADERPYAMTEIIDTVERVLERDFGIACRHRRLRLPGVASRVAAGVDAALQQFGLYHQKIHVLGEMDRDIACSVEAAKAELGYRPTVALEEGMRRSIADLVARRVDF
jgi:nucleoside-diphosphate-sugar epimerase